MKKRLKKKTARDTKKADVTKLGESAALKIAKRPDTSRTDLRKLVGRFDKVDRALAKRDDLSATALEELSHSSDRITRRNVAANSNCNTRTLLHLAPQFPAEFLDNPRLDWMLIEDPASFHKLDEKVLMEIFKRQDCPTAFLRWAADHKSIEVKLAVISNKETPEDVLKRLARSRNKRISAAARAHEKLAEKISEDELDKTFRDAVRELLAGDVQEEQRLKYIGLAQFPYLSLAARLNFASLREVPEEEAKYRRTCKPKEIRWLANSALVQDRIRAARSPQCPPDLLRILATENDLHVTSSVAANPNCPPDLLKKLASAEWCFPNVWLWCGKHEWICSFVAANPKCPRELLIELAGRKDRWIRSGVAANPKCPAGLLQKLARNKDPWVRSCVAANSGCPKSTRARIIKALATNKDRHARSCAAANPKCTADLLEKLATDKNKLWIQLYRGGGIKGLSCRSNVAANPSCPADLLEELAADENETIRKRVAANPNCPSDLLAKLAADKIAEVRREVAEHENCSPDTFERLLKDSKWDVLHTAISSDRCSDYLRRKAAQRISDKGSITVRKAAAKYWGNGFMRSRNLVKALAADEKPAVRKALAGNPQCPSGLYEHLLDDNDDAVRLSAALNVSHPVNSGHICKKPASSPWLLEKLAKAESDFPGITAAVQDGNILFPAPKTGKALRSTSLLGRIIALSQLDAAPEELARASGYRDWRQRMAIARNPATPPKILEKLCEDSNRHVAAQASATLRRDKKKSKALASKIKVAKTSTATDVDYTLLSQWIGERVREDPGGAGIVETSPFGRTVRIDKLFVRPREAWAAYISVSAWWNPNSLTPALIQEIWDQRYGKRAPSLVKLLTDESTVIDVDLAEKLARSRHCPKDLLEHLSTSETSAIRQAIAEKPNCPAELLAQLSKDRSRNVRLAVAANRSCPSLIRQSFSEDIDLRGNVAENPKCPIDLLEKLAKDKSERVRSRVAANRKCPADLLSKLATDKNSEVRCAVAEHSKCPADQLLRFAIDKVVEVRQNVAEHPNSPDRALEKLAADKNWGVRDSVFWRRNLPAGLLEKLATNKSAAVREQVAAHKKCPVKVLKQLARDKNSEVRLGVAEHPKCPPVLQQTLLKKLATDKSLDVRVRVLWHRKCPTTERHRLIQEAATHREIWTRKRVAEASFCPADVLRKLAKDNNMHVLRSVAGNCKCPADVLKKLASKKGSWVREEVAKTQIAQPKCLQSLQNPNTRKEFENWPKPRSRGDAIMPKRKVKRRKNAVLGASKPKPRPSRKTSKKKAPPVDAKTRRLAELIHDALTGKEPVPVVVPQEDYLEMFEILGLLFVDATGREVSAATRSKDRLKRMAAAMHPAATRGTLEKLADDSEQVIRDQALLRLAELS